MLTLASEHLPSPPYDEPVNLSGLKRLQLPSSLMLKTEMLTAMQDPSYGAMLRLAMCSLQQVPAGSLPMDERELRLLAGMVRSSEEEWARFRGMLAMNWTGCSDGRYYSFSMVEPVLAMWRQLQGARKGAQRSVASRQNRPSHVA